MTIRKKIAILASDEPHHQYLIDLMLSNFNIVAIVIEPMKEQRLRRLKNKQYINYLYYLYHQIRRELLGLNHYRSRYFQDSRSTSLDNEVQTLEVPWINDAKVEETLKNAEPDLTVVIGTSILKRNVLEVAGDNIINLHGGYLPYYRGNHCFFFAIYNEELDKIGSTIHFVDSGIDTGNIIELVVPPIKSEDFQSALSVAEILYCRAEKLAIHRLIEWVKYWENGGELPRYSQGLRGNLYKTRDRQPYHDLILWLRKLRGKLQPKKQCLAK